MTIGPFKTYQRDRRQFNIDADFSKGMLSSESPLDPGYIRTLVNYDVDVNNNSLKPRPGLHTSELILPHISASSDFNNTFHKEDDLVIVASRESVEEGIPYIQLILARKEEVDTDSKLFIVTGHRNVHPLINENTLLSYSNYKEYDRPLSSITSTINQRNMVHNMEKIENDKLVYKPVGSFAFGNSFYFWGSTSPDVARQLMRTVFSSKTKQYIPEKVVPKTLDPNEAVTYGYNMLLNEEAYTFSNRITVGSIQLTGILPYSSKERNKLLLTPKHNEDIILRCFFNGEAGKVYKFVWEWKHVGEDSWTELSNSICTIVEDFSGIYLRDEEGTLHQNLETIFKAPTSEVLVRVQAFPIIGGQASDIVEKAMTVGFDFSIETYGNTTNIEPLVYDLSQCSGMEFWKNRLVVYGLVEDPTILFISDVNDPSYFPYPNNISIFDEEILCVKAFKDSLLVFTTTQIHQVTLDDSGLSWNSTVVQSNLHIDKGDLHLIQTVKNMVYFKSGDHYFMIVPKAQSTTGELILAPISNSIIGFLNNFEHEVHQIIKETYGYSGKLELYDYYNYLDYADIHNVYVFKTVESKGFLYVALIYSTENRSWRVYTYESNTKLYPFQYDATQRSKLISTSVGENITKPYKVTKRFEPSSEVILDSCRVWCEGYRTFSQTFENATVLDVVYASDDVTLPVYVSELFNKTSSNGDYIFYESESGDLTLTVKILESDSLYNSKYDILLATAENSTKRLPLGGFLSIENRLNMDMGPITVNAEMFPKQQVAYRYRELDLQPGETVIINEEQYTLISGEGNIIQPNTNVPYGQKELLILPQFQDLVEFYECFDTPPVLFVSTSVDEEIFEKSRYFQIHEWDSNNVSDYEVTPSTTVTSALDYQYNVTFEPTVLKYNNWQFLDTGFRKDNFVRNKRYREVQLQLNNIEGVNLEFGLEFQIDGQPRLSYYSYDIEHVVDYSDPNYGLIYIQNNVDMNLPTLYVKTPNETVLGPDRNSWILNQSMFPELSLWKVRAAVSGKGYAPRIRLVGRNPYKYEILGINWVSRLMNAR